MKRIFETASTYEFSPRAEEVVLVTVNSGAVLTATSLPRYLVTSHTNVCTGLALVSEEACALTHIYSDMKFFTQGRDEVEAHARFAWKKFDEILPDNTDFSATAFGGRDWFPGAAKKSPGKKAIDAFMQKALTADENYTAIEDSDECRKLEENIQALNAQDQINGLKHEELVKLLFMEKKLSDMLQAPYKELQEEPYHKTGLYLAAQVSKWLGDEFYKSAIGSGRIEKTTDHRFHLTPHDVIVDCAIGRVTIGQTEKNSPLPNPFNRGYHDAPKLFDGYGLRSLDI